MAAPFPPSPETRHQHWQFCGVQEQKSEQALSSDRVQSLGGTWHKAAPEVGLGVLLGAGVRATREKWSEAEVFLCHVLVLQVRNRCRGGGSRSQAVSAGRWREKLCAGGTARESW